MEPRRWLAWGGLLRVTEFVAHGETVDLFCNLKTCFAFSILFLNFKCVVSFQNCSHCGVIG